MRGQGLNDPPRRELARRSFHNQGIFFELSSRLFHLLRPCIETARPMFRQPCGSGEAVPSAGLGRRPCRAPADTATNAAIRP
jgi:hypothetical protein